MGHRLYWGFVPRPGPNPPRVPIAKERSVDALKVAAFSVGMVVSAARNRAGLTQEELAAKSGLSQASISFIELGKPVAGASDAKIDAMFKTIRVAATGPQAQS